MAPPFRKHPGCRAIGPRHNYRYAFQTPPPAYTDRSIDSGSDLDPNAHPDLESNIKSESLPNTNPNTTTDSNAEPDNQPRGASIFIRRPRNKNNVNCLAPRPRKRPTTMKFFCDTFAYVVTVMGFMLFIGAVVLPVLFLTPRSGVQILKSNCTGHLKESCIIAGEGHRSPAPHVSVEAPAVSGEWSQSDVSIPEEEIYPRLKHLLMFIFGDFTDPKIEGPWTKHLRIKMLGFNAKEREEERKRVCKEELRHMRVLREKELGSWVDVPSSSSSLSTVTPTITSSYTKRPQETLETLARESESRIVEEEDPTPFRTAPETAAAVLDLRKVIAEKEEEYKQTMDTNRERVADALWSAVEAFKEAEPASKHEFPLEDEIQSQQEKKEQRDQERIALMKEDFRHSMDILMTIRARSIVADQMGIPLDENWNQEIVEGLRQVLMVMWEWEKDIEEGEGWLKTREEEVLGL